MSTWESSNELRLRPNGKYHDRRQWSVAIAFSGIGGYPRNGLNRIDLFVVEQAQRLLDLRELDLEVVQIVVGQIARHGPQSRTGMATN